MMVTAESGLPLPSDVIYHKNDSERHILPSWIQHGIWNNVMNSQHCCSENDQNTTDQHLNEYYLTNEHNTD